MQCDGGADNPGTEHNGVGTSHGQSLAFPCIVSSATKERLSAVK
jgi:hypothetical protein